MAGDRVVKVSLQAQVANYVANMDAAAKSTKKVGDSLEAQKAASIAAAKAQGVAAQEIGRGMVAVGALAAVSVALAVKKFADFDQAMSNVKAVTQETTSNMADLRDAALDFGASSVFTATEAANAIEELGKAGISTADILGGALEGSLNLASAGELGIARAAEVASTTLKQFGLEGDQASRVADTLAAGAGKALGSVDDLANGLKFVGPVAADMGASLEETTGVLAMFAQQGIIGEQAGTSLRGMLSSLTSPSSMARKEMEALGVTLYDSQGRFLGLENAAGELNKAYAGMTDAQRDASLGVLFGNQQITAARILYRGGAEGVAEWTDAVSESGYAAQVANDRLDNLMGDIEGLGGAFDTYLIRSGSSANDVLRGLVQSLTFVIEVVGDMPEPVLGAGLALGTATAAVGLVGGTALVAIPKIVALKESLGLLGLTAGGVTKAVLLTGGAIAGATLAIGFFVGRAAQAAANTTELAASLDAATGATTEYTRELVARKLAESGAFEAAKEAGITQRELTDAVLEGGEALDEVKRKLGENNNIGTFFTGVGIRAGNASMEVRDLAKSVQDSTQQFEDQKAAGTGAAGATATAAEAYKDAAGEAKQLNDNLMSLIDTINEANGVGQDAVSTNAAYRSALENVDKHIAKAKKGVEGYSLGLDASTAAGSANLKMISDLAADYQAAAEAQFALDGNTENYVANLSAGQKAVLDRAKALGATDEQIQFLTDHIVAMPSEKEVKIIAETSEAQRRLDNIKRTLDSFRGSNSTVTAYVREVGGRADGGAISGPGGPRDDAAGLFRLSDGEHVLTASDVDRMGGQEGVYAFRASLYRGLADGGAVGYAPPRYAPPTGGVGNVYINAPIMSDSGTLEGYVRGVAGQVTDLRFEREIGRQFAASAGRRK